MRDCNVKPHPSLRRHLPQRTRRGWTADVAKLSARMVQIYEKRPETLSHFRTFYAEKPGFEPGLRLTHTTPLAGEPLRPLGYFSMSSKYEIGGERGIRTPGAFRHHWFSRPAPSTARPSLLGANQRIRVYHADGGLSRYFSIFSDFYADRRISPGKQADKSVPEWRSISIRGQTGLTSHP